MIDCLKDTRSLAEKPSIKGMLQVLVYRNIDAKADEPVIGVRLQGPPGKRLTLCRPHGEPFIRLPCDYTSAPFARLIWRALHWKYESESGLTIKPGRGNRGTGAAAGEDKNAR